MSGNTNSGSDVGFIVLIAFTIIALIPLAIGFESFEELIHIGKIILIVILVVAVVAGAILGYFIFKGKIRRRNTQKEGRKDENERLPKQENTTKVEIKEERKRESIEPVFIADDETNINLKQINEEYDF